MRSPASARSISSTAAKASIGRTTNETAGNGEPTTQSPGKQILDRLYSPAPANDQTDAAASADPLPNIAPRKTATPKGIAFAIPELLMVQAWAVANDVAMRIYLDHGSRSEEYEEAISIQPQAGPVGRSLIWRNQTHVYVQPLLGRRRRYTTISAALESLAPESPVSVTDIVAKSWPKD